MEPYPWGLERGSSTKWFTNCCVSGKGTPPVAWDPLPGCPSATSRAAAYWFSSNLALSVRICSLKLEDEVQLKEGGKEIRSGYQKVVWTSSYIWSWTNLLQLQLLYPKESIGLDKQARELHWGITKVKLVDRDGKHAIREKLRKMVLRWCLNEQPFCHKQTNWKRQTTVFLADRRNKHSI